MCSVSSRKSNSNWLDRLRSAKGFPPGEGDGADTDQNQSNFPNSPGPGPQIQLSSGLGQSLPAPVSEPPNFNQQGTEVFDTVSNVLAELFAFGPGTSKIQSKKASRKQPNPRIFNVNNGNEGFNSRASPVSDDHSRIECKESVDQAQEFFARKKGAINNGGAEEEDEEETRDFGLPGFSKTEVTVIDTSCPGWKFEKLLFMKKNVWKVRDKKSKTLIFGKKKRKARAAEREDVAWNEKKQMGLDAQCCLPKDPDRGEFTEQINEEDHLQSGKLVEAPRRTSNNVFEVSKKKHLVSSQKSSSSVVLIQSIPASKENGASTSRSCLKPPMKPLKS